ncbi:MAG: cation diffusion facilitator family transporter [Flaviaesturariibacter sp.]|nr:cation diffusion facilitator family transporter [Flaviaesturariibacter sp.]
MEVISDQQAEKNSNLKLQLWIAIASTLLLIAKFIAYFLTNSVAVLTDALESIVNVAAAFIGLYSLYVSAKPRDANHPYGHGKAEFISAAVEGTLVLSAGAIIIYKAVKSFLDPQAISQLDMGIYIISATAIINWVLGEVTQRQGIKNNSLALLASGKHLKTDSYSTLGIIGGLLLISLTNFLWIDALVAIIFGLLIIYTGYKIIRQSLAGIMDEADTVLLGKMVAVLNQNRRDFWVDLHNLRVIKYGNTLHVDCHLTVPWYLNVNQAHNEIDNLGSLIRQDFGESLELFVHSDGCRYFQCPICDKKECPVRQHDFQKEVVWTVDNILQNKRHGLADAGQN